MFILGFRSFSIGCCVYFWIAAQLAPVRAKSNVKSNLPVPCGAISGHVYPFRPLLEDKTDFQQQSPHRLPLAVVSDLMICKLKDRVDIFHDTQCLHRDQTSFAADIFRCVMYHKAILQRMERNA